MHPMLEEIPLPESTTKQAPEYSQEGPADDEKASPSVLSSHQPPPPKKRGRKPLVQEAAERGISLETLRAERQATKTGAKATKARPLPSNPAEALAVTEPYRQQAASIVRFLSRLLTVFGYGLQEAEENEGVFAVSALLYEQSIAFGAIGLVAVWGGGVALRIGLEERKKRLAKKTEVAALAAQIENLPAPA